MYAIYGDIYHQYTPNVSIYIYISYMDPMGHRSIDFICFQPETSQIFRTPWGFPAFRAPETLTVAGLWRPVAPRPSATAVAGSLAAADAATGRVAGTQLDVAALLERRSWLFYSV